MKRSSLPLVLSAAALAASIPVAWALTPPAWIDEAYRQCMSTAIESELNERVQVLRTYNDEQVRDLEAYRDSLRSAWQIADEDQRRERLRDADKAYRDASREAKRTYDTRVREIRNESRDAQRECRKTQTEHERFVKDMCFSTADCRSNQICTTEQGACDSSCPPGAASCAQVCAGTCERPARSSRSSTSRSTSFRSSSSRSSNGARPWEDYQSNGQTCRSSGECPNGYFCGTTLGECNSPCAPGQVCTQVCQGFCRLYPLGGVSSSSRSSTPVGGGTPGTNCTPYRCADGREVPSCDASGNPINYFQNPCYS